ncbi:MAG: FAD-dependent oxidoreductase [Stigonema ocellatum SAG 48.90 = DSM 106950]|nr:FAD-dependent oxidoreductase [Stigonema ocellatum SAG 48.90 = DSM 106950]
MARSSLIDIVRSTYRWARLSNQCRIPLDELIDLGKQKISRRRLLYGGLGMASAVAVSTLDRRPSVASVSATPVLIVGAGMAGLIAAYRLTQAGVPVHIVEARNNVGGRMRSLSNAAGTSTTVELGGEFIDSSHTNLLTVVQELGLETGDILAAGAGLEANTWYFQGRKVPLVELVTAFKPLAKQIDKDIARIGSNPVTYKSYNQRAEQLDKTSLAEYLDRYCQNPLLNQLIRVAYVTEYGREAEEQSSLNLLLLIGTGTTVDTFSIYGTSDQQYQVIGGNQQIPELLAQQLTNFIETGTVLEAIQSLSASRYRVSFRSGGYSFERTYERVLLALPFSTLRQVRLAVDLPPVKQRAIQELGYGTNAKLITAYQERIWLTRYNSTASVYTDLGFQNTWESTPFASGTPGLITDFVGGLQGLSLGKNTPLAQAKILLSQLNQVFPGISDLQQGAAIRAYWPAETYTRGSYSCWLVGQYTTIAGSESKRVGNLFFAGEHCSLRAQGYMEGACETGVAAAQHILQDLGLRSKDSLETRSVRIGSKTA